MFYQSHLNYRHSFASSRLISPELCSSPHPLMKEGAGKTGCRLAPTVHCAKVALQEAAQRHTGEAKTSGLPCAVV